jgi:hypothetical protein
VARWVDFGLASKAAVVDAAFVEWRSTVGERRCECSISIELVLICDGVSSTLFFVARRLQPQGY